MKQEVYRSSFQIAELDLEKGLFIERFSVASKDYTDDSYKTDFLAFSKIILKAAEARDITFALIDMRNFFFTISPKLQEWHNENIFSLSDKVGLKKMAVLSSPDFVASLSVEQTTDEAVGLFATKFFDNEEAAMNWLFS